MANIKQTVKLGVFTLAIMNVTAVVSLRGLPAEAVYGMSSAFYYLFAAIVFLIPTSLVAAELAAMFQDKQGGVFRWVGEAYGKKLGFLAIWVQWIESTIWYPTVLTFGAVSIAFIGMNDVHDMSLANNKYYTLAVVLVIYWLATFISLKGMSWVGKVAKVGGLVGTIIPAGLLIVLGIIYLATGGHSNMDFHSSFFPDLTNFDNVVLAASIFLFYAGMEMGGIHVKDVNNPSKNYPKAVFIGALITVLIFVLGTFALGVIIPAKDISLTQSLLVGFDNYFRYIHASWLSPVIAVALAFGVLAGVLTWVAGPSKGIFAVGKAGYMPPFFQKTNKLGVQKNILFVQGGAVTVLSLLFVVMPSVQSFYQILSQLTVVLYLIMYMLMFSGAIVLRYKMKKLNRPFRIGKGGNGLMWLVGGLGFCGSLLAFVLSFIPPSQISTGSNTVIKNAEHVTYRAWFPVEAAGEYDYRFYFSNTVDSTWGDGSESYVGMSGGNYTIEKATVYDGGTEFDANVEPTVSAAVTFSGSAAKEVAPDETFWSDPVTLNVPEGHYLLWEWTVNGTNIPAISMSNLTYAYADKGDGKGFLYTNEIPVPQLVGCDRKVKTRIITLGDSVTQGCQTSEFGYQFWAAQLLDQLGTEDYSLWNLGIGYARASDCARQGNWLNRAVAGADLITVAFGTNDIISGPYGGTGHATPEEIEADVRKITRTCTDAGIRTILWNSPPFDMTPELDGIRTAYNETVEGIAKDNGATYFDVASLLADPSDASKTVYGQHPNDEGGTVITDALVKLIQE